MSNLLDALDIDFSTLSFRDYWGPDKDYVFDQFKNLPFAPFNKMEKIGKACDFTLLLSKPQLPQQTTTKGGFDEESEFMIVENKSVLKSKMIRKKQIFKPMMRNDQKAKQQPQRQQYTKFYAQKTKFKESTIVKSDWAFIHDVMKNSADKVIISSLPQAQIIKETGTIREFDSAFSKIMTKNERPLVVKEGGWGVASSTTVDPIMLEIIEKDVEESKSNTILYATDYIITALMTLKHSNFPFEIIVNKNDNFIIMDKPEKNVQSWLDFQTVSENTSSNLPEDEKEMLKLCTEATNINKNFQAQIQTGQEKFFGEENKAIKSDRKVAYHYKRFTLDGKLEVVLRVEIDAYTKDANGKENYCVTRALNEFDFGTDWRKKLESNKGALVTSEIRNNSCKVNKWVCQAFLAEADSVKLGYVSRLTAKDYGKHSILGGDSYSVRDLAQIISFKMKDCWMIIRYLMEYFSKQANGKYAIVKMPWKQQMRIFRIPEEKKEEI